MLFGFGSESRCRTGTHRSGNRCIKINYKTGRINSKFQSGSKPLRPLFSYFGGKQRVAEKIIKKFPNHDILVEPFLGGGSVYWKDTQAKRYVINDKVKILLEYIKQQKINHRT